MRRIIFLVFLFPIISGANERIRDARTLKAEGYQVFLPSIRGQGQLPAQHSLDWPVKFQDSKHSVANSMAQFQPFGDPYFHGGCDLRVSEAEAVYAPVRGTVEAGYYSYDTNPDGSLTKYWKPWPQKGERLYFEVAVISNGVRYEFHHIDPNSLPQQIIQILRGGGGEVEVGTPLGKTVYWPDGDYHHVHYNVVLPNGVRTNPEWVSRLVPDRLAPQVQGVYSVNRGGRVEEVLQSSVLRDTAEFVVAVKDFQDDNVYEHPAARLELETGATFWALDFQKELLESSGSFPALWSVFAKQLTLPSGRTLKTTGGYGVGLSLMRIPVPKGAQGRFSIRVSDISGNQSTIEGQLN